MDEWILKMHIHPCSGFMMYKCKKAINQIGNRIYFICLLSEKIRAGVEITFQYRPLALMLIGKRKETRERETNQKLFRDCKILIPKLSNPISKVFCCKSDSRNTNVHHSTIYTTIIYLPHLPPSNILPPPHGSGS